MRDQAPLPVLNRNFIIITTINAPTEAVARFARMSGWQLVVVGDTKTPAGWRNPEVTYLGPAEQEAMSSPLVRGLPWRSYSRKMAGYLHAMEHGAGLIAEADDDNIPVGGWGDALKAPECETVHHDGFLNVYRYFCEDHVWPRGFPLDDILKPVRPQPGAMGPCGGDVAVWQFLADEDPDVDAIYRLTSNRPVYFRKRPLLKLAPGTLCPFNSQNTVFRRDVFALMYLPVHVTFRTTDILRGLVAQPVLWAAGLTLCFGHATVVQKRNPHDYLKDFESEIPCFLNPKRVIDLVQKAVSSHRSIPDNLHAAYEALHAGGIVKAEELPLVEAWLSHFPAGRRADRATPPSLPLRRSKAQPRSRIPMAHEPSKATTPSPKEH